MKKFAIILILVVFASSLCFAEPLTKQLSIQGGYDEVASIKIVPIASQAEAYKIGMPFAINDSSVLYTQDTYRGRLIAKWNVLTNFDFKLEIILEALHHYEDSTTTKDAYPSGLGYALTFVYDISYVSGSEPQYLSDNHFTVSVSNSQKTNTVIVNDMLKNQVIDRDTLVGAADGEIYFKFDQSTTLNRINDSTFFNSPQMKNGNYLANVIFNIKAM